MRTSQPLLALAAVATSALTGLGLASPADAATGTATREVGNVIECTGHIAGRSAWVSLYENNTAVNVIQVTVGGDRNPVGNSRQVPAGFLDGHRVLGSLELDGDRAVVRGRATRVGDRVPVHEEQTDAGEQIVVDGFHRALSTDLTLTWRHRTKALTCDNAFHYDLQVTRTDITG